MSVLTTNYKELEESIMNIARKYSRNTSIPFEDFMQELWLKIIETSAENLAIAREILVNRAIDISRANWRDQNRNTNTDFSDPVMSDVIIPDKTEDDNMKEDHICSEDDYIGIEIISVLDGLKEESEKAYKYAVAKAYLNGNLIFLKKRFEVLYEELDDSEKTSIDSVQSNYKYTDDIILKVFCKIKSGTNSGSARTIKKLVKETFTKVY